LPKESRTQSCHNFRRKGSRRREEHPKSEKERARGRKAEGAKGDGFSGFREHSSSKEVRGEVASLITRG